MTPARTIKLTSAFEAKLYLVMHFHVITCECRTPHRLSEHAVFHNKSRHPRSLELSEHRTEGHAVKAMYPSIFFQAMLVCQYCILTSCHIQYQTLLQEFAPEIHFEAATIEIPIDHFNPQITERIPTTSGRTTLFTAQADRSSSTMPANVVSRTAIL